MALSAPTRPVWAVSVVLAAVGVLGKLVAIPFVSAHAGWWIVAGFVVLLVGTSYKGL